MIFILIRLHEQARLGIQSLGAEFAEGFLCLLPAALGFLLLGDCRIDLLEQFYFGVVGLDGAPHGAGEMLVEHIVALATVAGDSLAGALGHLPWIDCR